MIAGYFRYFKDTLWWPKKRGGILFLEIFFWTPQKNKKRKGLPWREKHQN